MIKFKYFQHVIKFKYIQHCIKFCYMYSNSDQILMHLEKKKKNTFASIKLPVLYKCESKNCAAKIGYVVKYALHVF